MKLIPLEEALKSTESWVYPSDDEIRIRKKILSLPTIDPIEEIDKMQEELKKEDENLDTLDDMEMGISTWKSIMLKRIKERLSLTQK